MKNNDSITPQFLACYDSWAAVACPKLRPSWINKITIVAKRVYTLFQFWSHEPFEWWVLDNLCGEAAQKACDAERSLVILHFGASSCIRMSTSNLPEYRSPLVDQMLEGFQMHPRIPEERWFLKGNRHGMRMICSFICIFTCNDHLYSSYEWIGWAFHVNVWSTAQLLNSQLVCEHVGEIHTSAL